MRDIPESEERLQTRNAAAAKSFLVPGGVLLLVAAVLLQSGCLPLTPPGLTFVYYAILTAGLLLAWRFHSSRVFLALLVLLLAQQGIASFSGARFAIAGTNRSSVEVVGFLLPLNLALLSLMRERSGFTAPVIGPTSLVLFVEAGIVTVLGREPGPSLPSRAHHAVTVAPLPAYVWVAFAAAAILLVARFVLFRKPAEISLFWSQTAFFIGLHNGGVGKTATAYFATAALILVTAVIETSYALAYHDELTTLPSRRAFHGALLRLQHPYSIAAVDIDHFKRFNDTYGHETGDQVLRLVASRLARVGGGGEAYRCGGEEFAILFPGKTTKEVVDHLELLRAAIEASSFHMRGCDRRQMPRGPDRRSRGPRRRSPGRAIRQLAQTRDPVALSVSVSIGVATSTGDASDPNRVIQAADKALYRAKALGRNRTETASAIRRVRAKTAGIA